MIVVDSSFLIAYHNRPDVHHASANQVMTALVTGRWGRALLLEYVFVEVATVLLAPVQPPPITTTSALSTTAGMLAQR